jgi:ubiquinone biosynthesis monooxygenase Coq7
LKKLKKQVVKHLEKHLDKVSKNDIKTIEILKTMRADEDEHAQEAMENGSESLSEPTKKVMNLTAKVMTSSSAYI